MFTLFALGIMGMALLINNPVLTLAAIIFLIMAANEWE